jgi:hypothetical protein
MALDVATSLERQDVATLLPHAALLEDVFISGADAGAYGWVTQRLDPFCAGRNRAGRWQGEIEIAAHAAVVLLARILPTAPKADHVTLRTDRWIDLLVRQFPATHPSLCGLFCLEIAHYRRADGQADSRAELLKAVKSSPMPLAISARFSLGYRFKNGKVSMALSESQDGRATRLEAVDFGETLPWIKLRSGQQALSSGIFRAAFRQLLFRSSGGT